MNGLSISASSVEINGVKYVPESSVVPTPALTDYYVFRCRSAGVFYGVIKEDLGDRAVIVDRCRRIHLWQGAKSCSGIALHGVNAAGSNVSEPTNGHRIEEVIERIPMTEEAVKVMAGTTWK